MAGFDSDLPSFSENQISREDNDEFLTIRATFRQRQKLSAKERRVLPFRQELLIALEFIERRPQHMEARAVLAGVCFAGRLICVNTRQLKSFLARCKSSINISFQNLGFVALRGKAKARDCVLAVLPSLNTHPTILRQWTARYVSDHAQFSYYSIFPYRGVPAVKPEELFEPERVCEGQPPEQAKKLTGSKSGTLALAGERREMFGRAWNLFDEEEEEWKFFR
jgi:hypothetical protein